MNSLKKKNDFITEETKSTATMIDYSDLFENAPIPYIVINSKMDIVAANVKFSDVTGFAASKINNSDISKYISLSDFKALQKAIESLNNHKETVSLTSQIMLSGGHQKPSKLTISKCIAKSNEYLYYIAITESDDTVHAETKFESIFKCIPEPCFILNDEFQIVDWNDVAANLTGIGSRHAKNSRLEDLHLISEDDIQKLNEMHERTLEGNHTTSSEFKFTAPNDEEVWMLLYSCPLIFDDGRFIFCMAVDISSRQRLLKEYEATKKQLSAVLNSVADLVFFKDINSVYQGCNKSFEKYANMPESDIIGKTDFDLCDTESAQRFLKDDREMIKCGEVRVIDEQGALNDGRNVIFETIKSPIFDETGNVIGMVGVSRDATERKSLEAKQNEMFVELRKLNEKNIEQLHKLNKLNLELSQSQKKLKQLNDTKDKFFSIIAHDLRNPFHLLRTISEIIISNYDDMQHEEIKSKVKDINDSSNQAYKLLDNLLTWSRSQTGKIRFEPASHDIYELIINSSYAMRNHAKRKNININQDVKLNTTAEFDYNMIETILRNLISNAIKFTDSGGSITIASSIVGNNLKLSVADNGVGISSARQEKLFSISESLSTRGTSQESGTGLGLILTKEFVDYHHGTITVESVPGKGSTFIVQLPLSQPKAQTTKMQGNADV